MWYNYVVWTGVFVLAVVCIVSSLLWYLCDVCVFWRGKAWVAFNQLQAVTGLIYGTSELRNLRHERNILNGGWQDLVVDTLLLQLDIQDLQAWSFICGVLV